MPAPKTRLHSHKIIKSVSQSPPAVRMVVLMTHAWRNDEGEVESWTDTFPVLLIRSVVQNSYSRETHPEARAYRHATHREMLHDGWHYNYGESGVDEELLIYTDEFGICTPEFHVSSNGEWVAVACQWPPEDDAHRLVEIRAQLDAKVREGVPALVRAEPMLAESST